jgi:chemotaxis protein MotB
VSETTSGSGGILGGTALGDEGAKGNGSRSVIEQLAPEAPPNVKESGQSQTNPGASSSAADTAAMSKAQQAKDEAAFQSAAQSLRQALQDMPELAELSKQIIIDETPEGLRITLVDQDGRSMFKEGSAQPNDRARLLLRAVARVINGLPNRVTIAGHTSASINGAKSEGDWGLSAQRADTARQILQGAGVPTDRIYQVSGKATSDPLYPDDPTLAGNRRISIVLLREAPVLPPE